MREFSEEYKVMIDWSGTGDVTCRDSIYDHEETAEGQDDDGNDYTGCAVFSSGELIDVTEIEKV